MNCACHDQPAYWLKDARMTAGGWWRCGVKHRTKARERYDRNPIHRIEKNLHDHARRRRQTIDRRRVAHEQEA